MILRLPLSSISIPPYRQRKEFDSELLAELTDSIQSHGLLHPVVVRVIELEGGARAFQLVAGERRLRAIGALSALSESYRFGEDEFPSGMVPAISLGALDELSAESAELEENIRRTDLSWQERDVAIARLALLRGKQALAAGHREPTVGDIAREVEGRSDGAYHERTRRAIILAENFDKPEVAKAKSQDEAWKALKRLEENRKNEARARELGPSFTSSVHSLLKADCIEWMHAQEAGQFDVICTDPPYGIDADSFGDAGGRLVHQTHEYSDSSEEAWANLIQAFFVESFRLAKPEAHLYMCCDVDFFVLWKRWAEVAGWKPFRTPLINFKKDGSRVPLPEHGPQRKYELILFANKGNKRVTRIYPDVIETSGDENLGHGAQKPVALFQDLLKRSVTPGDRVLDPFCGTGTIFPASHALMCRATGIEQKEAYYGMALKRLQELS